MSSGLIRYDGSTEETRAQGRMDVTRLLVFKMMVEGHLDEPSLERVEACTDQHQLDTWLGLALSRFSRPATSED